MLEGLPMDDRELRALEILEALGARPAVPFFEGGPARYIVELLSGMGVAPAVDRFGNVIGHYQGGGSASGGRQPPIALVAHMDHPGFELIEAGQHGYMARALGGVPAATLKAPTPAQVLMPDGRRLPAELVPPDQPLSDDPADRLTLLRLENDVALEPPLPVVFDLPDFQLDGDYIRMRALDDLAGCAATLAAVERLAHGSVEADVYAVFTRAEETGLFGARLMAEAGTLPAETLVVSIESSAVIPGVAQGDGPVIRTGDALYTFDADAEQVLIVAREAIRARDSGFKSQRQLMSGGVCEATAFAVFGYRATGLAFPLGNYHNATTSIPDEGGGVDAEYIRLSDYLGGVELLTEAAGSVAARDDSPARRRIRGIPEEARVRLETTSSW
jgi:putative aminopeptidase FrvX